MKEAIETISDKINRHKDLLTIVGSILIGFFWIHGAVSDIRHDIQQQAARTDRLYEMYCDMQKEIKDIYIMNTKES